VLMLDAPIQPPLLACERPPSLAWLVSCKPHAQTQGCAPRTCEDLTREDFTSTPWMPSFALQLLHAKAHEDV
jgi:hypothetical protein